MILMLQNMGVKQAFIDDSVDLSRIRNEKSCDIYFMGFIHNLLFIYYRYLYLNIKKEILQ